MTTFQTTRSDAKAVHACAVADVAVRQDVAVPAAVVLDNALRGAAGEPGGTAAGVDEVWHQDHRAAGLACLIVFFKPSSYQN